MNIYTYFFLSLVSLCINLMSEAKLQKYLKRQLVKPEGIQNKIAIVLSDSKAGYLKPYLEDSKVTIIWWTESGATTTNRLQFLKRRLSSLVKESSNKYVVYVWTGTCDLTYKEKGLIYLRSGTLDDTYSVQKLQDTFLELRDFCRGFKNVQVVFLELPPYSIYQYNTRSGSLGSEEDNRLKSLDKILFQQIEKVNDYLRSLNREDNFTSPTFKNDVFNNRKSSNREATDSFSYPLTRDGIHPGESLSRVWMRRILIQIYINCY